MSWGVSASGTVEEVRASLENQYAMVNLEANPAEQAVFESAKDTVSKGLAGMDASATVRVIANGSQSTYFGTEGAPDRITQNVRVSVEADPLV